MTVDLGDAGTWFTYDKESKNIKKKDQTQAIPEQVFNTILKVTDNSNQDSFWFMKINVYHFEPEFSDLGSQEEPGLERPKFKSLEIDKSGLLTVYFSEKLFIP